MTLPTWTIDTQSTSTSFKVPGLLPGKQYSVTVTPTNTVGTGPASTAVTFTTAAQATSAIPSIVSGQIARFRADGPSAATTTTLSLPSVPNINNKIFVFVNGWSGFAATNQAISAPSSATLIGGPYNDGTLNSEVMYIYMIQNDVTNSYTFGNYDTTSNVGFKIIEVANASTFDIAHGQATETSTTSISWPMTVPTNTNVLRLTNTSLQYAPGSIGAGTTGITVLTSDPSTVQYHAGFLASLTPSTSTGSVAITGGQTNATDGPVYVSLNLYGAQLPAQVTNLTASNVTSSGCKLQWTALADTSVTAYTVNYEGGGITSFTQYGAPVPATTNSDTITGLLPNTAYTFQVFASNSAGDGVPSANVSITTPTQQALLVKQTASVGRSVTASTTLNTLTATFANPTTVGNTLACFVTGFGDTNNLAAVAPPNAQNWTGILQDDGTGTDSICAFWTQPVTSALTAYSFTEFDDECSFFVVEIQGITSIGAAAHSGPLTYADNTSVTLPITAPTTTPAFGLYLLNMTNTPDSYGTMPSGITKLAASTGVSTTAVTYHQGAVFQAASSVATGNVTIPFSLATGTQLSAPTYIGVNFYGSAASTPPGQVTGLTLGTATSSSQALTWSAATGTVTSYTVQYKQHSSATWIVASTSVTTTSFTVTGLAAGTSYDFEVIAYNNTTAGTASAIVTNTTVSSAPSASTITLGSATTTTQPLSWSVPATGTVTSYTLQYKLASAASYTVFGSGLTGTTATITGLTPNSSYNYQVIPYNGTTAGPTSATATGSTLALTAPGQVTGVTLGTATSTAQPISWSVPGGTVTSYKVLYSATSSTGPWTTVQGITTTSTTVSGLTPSTVYYYQVFALNGTSVGAGSTVVNGSTGASSPPGQVVGITAGATTSTSIAFTWAVPSGSPTTYNFAWRPTSGGSFTTVTGLTSPAYTLTGLSALTSYTVQVTALSFGVSGTPSATFAASTSSSGSGSKLVLINGKILQIGGKNIVV